MANKDAVAVLIHIIEARDLKPRSSSGMCDALLAVSVFGDDHYTPVVKKDLSPYWNHYFHVEDKSASFQTEALRVSVYDTSTTFRKELIGYFDFELGDIHAQKNHEYHNVWVILSNHELKEKQGVQGYLKLSITVLRPGDTPVQHSEEEADETDAQEDDLANMVLLKPKGLDAVENILKAKMYKAENLPKMDVIGTCDPFVEVTYAGNTGSTPVIKNTQSPTWNSEVQLPITLPTMADNITVKLYDQDAAGQKDFISQTIVSFKDAKANTQAGKPFWKNFYRGEGQNKENVEYCGRVLLDFSTSIPEGKAQSVPIPAAVEPETTRYTLQFDAYECQGINAPLYPIYVVASMGPYSVASAKLKNKNHTAGFYESLPDLEFTLPSDINQVPDLFIYVYEDVPGDDKRHAYLRYSVSQLASIQGAPRWEVLKHKDAKDIEHAPGYIHFRLNFGPSAVIKQKPRQRVVTPVKKAYQFRAHIHAGRDLPAGDEDALSDPYCRVNVGVSRGKTRTIEHTVFPDWFETVSLDVELPDQRELAPDIRITVHDWDKTTGDEFLGMIVIPISEASTTKDLKAAKWYPLVLGEKTSKGEILASFQIIPAENAKTVPLPNLKPKYIDSQISIGVVGLRELVPFQLIPPGNAYIKFSVPGAPPVTTKKSKTPSPASPNYFENIVISAPLPEVIDFVPALLVEVFDPRPIKDAKIASASIPLVGFLPWAPQQAKLPFGVHLPPTVEDSAFFQAEPDKALIPAVANALVSNARAPLSQNQDHIIVDIPLSESDNATTPLLPKPGKGKSAVELGTIARRDIPDTTLPGLEAEPDEPQRQEVVSELEHQFKTFPFLEVDLFRGTSAGISTGNLFNKREAIVGKFKGAISVKSLSGSSSSKKSESAVDVTKLTARRPYVARVYVEQGQNLVPHDSNGSSDPYLVVFSTSPGKKGGKSQTNVINDKGNVKEHTLQPEFYKMYELAGVLPDDSELRVQVWDKDDIGADEFMGETRYDLEMLWFSEEWRKLQLKPKENRTLWHPLSAFPQGKLRMWVELLTIEEAGRIPPSPIGPPVREPFELRIVVWETRNVTPKDKIMGKESSDQFVMTKLLGHATSAQQTDVHNSVMNGCGKFNWRVVYHDVFLPYDTPRLKLQVYDKDAIGPNDAIAEANLNLKGFFQKGLRVKSAHIGARAALNPQDGVGNAAGGAFGTVLGGEKASAGPFNTGQWLDLFHPSFDGPQGAICLEVDLLTREEAAKRRAGDGRGEPNQNPYLPEPLRPQRKWFEDFLNFTGLMKFKKYLIIAAIVLVIIFVLIIAIQLS